MSQPRISVAELCMIRDDGGWRFTLFVTGLNISAGERIALIGPNGCGKSTLIEILALSLAPFGDCTFRLFAPEQNVDADVAMLWRDGEERTLTHLRRNLFGYVQQVGGLLGFLTIRQNVALTQRLSGRADPAWLQDLIESLEIGQLMERYPDQVSVGQRQRATIVRALAHRPIVLLADEPTASLDGASAEWVMRLLVEQSERAGAALVVASHDHDLLERYGFHKVSAKLHTEASGQYSVFEG